MVWFFLVLTLVADPLEAPRYSIINGIRIQPGVTPVSLKQQVETWRRTVNPDWIVSWERLAELQQAYSEIECELDQGLFDKQKAEAFGLEFSNRSVAISALKRPDLIRFEAVLTGFCLEYKTPEGIRALLQKELVERGFDERDFPLLLERMTGKNEMNDWINRHLWAEYGRIVPKTLDGLNDQQISRLHDQIKDLQMDTGHAYVDQLLTALSTPSRRVLVSYLMETADVVSIVLPDPPPDELRRGFERMREYLDGERTQEVVQ